MLKRVNRLRKRYQFAYVYRAGNFVSAKAVALHYTPSKTKNIKVGFAITKKIGHAIKRNLVRRRLREIVRKQIQNLNQNYNIVLVAKEPILETEFSELEKQIAYLFKKSGILKNDEKDN